MRIALVDDDVAFLAQTVRGLGLLLDERGVRADVARFALAGKLLDELSNGKAFDVYFLDVVMPGMDGVELGRRIRRDQPDAPLVFLTTSSDFALQAIGLEVADYLVKPFSQEAFAKALDRAFRRLSMVPPPALGFKTRDGCTSVPLKNIVCVEASGRYQIVQVSDGSTHVVLLSMQELWEKLQGDSRFLRIGRQHIVNLAQMRGLKEGVVVLANGMTIDVPRRSLAEVKRAFLHFFST